MSSTTTVPCNDNDGALSNGVVFFLTACAVLPLGAFLGAYYITNLFNAKGVKNLESAIPGALIDLVRYEKKKKKVDKKGKGKKGKKKAASSSSDSDSDSDSDSSDSD